MFWDRVAGVYDLFADLYNRKAHRALCAAVANWIEPNDEVLECACGTGLLTKAMLPRCKSLVATDFSEKMLRRAAQKCARWPHARFEKADILDLPYPDGAFDKVVAANVIHLLDDPMRALGELNRVCRAGGRIIIPTYINRAGDGKSSGFSAAAGKAGAGFKRQFSYGSYQRFFALAGYENPRFALAEGRVPCAVAVLDKKEEARI